MAFNPKQLFCLAQVGEVSMWSYEWTDAPATVIAAGYIPAGYGLNVGDTIFVTQYATADKLAVTAKTINYVSVAAATGCTLVQLAT